MMDAPLYFIFSAKVVQAGGEMRDTIRAGKDAVEAAAEIARDHELSFDEARHAWRYAFGSARPFPLAGREDLGGVGRPPP
jgi:hypothetical protein